MRTQKQNKGFTLIELMIVVAIIGILAVVAGPELGRYQKRAKTAEATQNISKIADGAKSYYLAEYTARNGDILPKQFPVSVGPTPPNPGCNGTSPLKHDPVTYNTPVHFGSASWQALQFSVSKPFLYQYQLESAGFGQDAKFSARAIGDLDCNTILSTYEQIGIVQAGEVVIKGQWTNPLNSLE
jgi:prepilin-type N-terminal cleavage/methylation domain-containing protein